MSQYKGGLLFYFILKVLFMWKSIYLVWLIYAVILLAFFPHLHRVTNVYTIVHLITMFFNFAACRIIIENH
jgi:hypothetical protein